MDRMAQRIVAEGLSVRSVEEIVTLGDRRPRRPPAGRAARRPASADSTTWPRDLSDRLETRVRIALGQRKGRLTVEFARVEDLNRILDAMAPARRARRLTGVDTKAGTRHPGA